ncbi:MAG: heavy-metal-associated domain-containing protein, partial [Verrucomicrobia bacterium]|nr:heavy-metal-associated domain-containing protein [Verrucomicrobiota bacterium]MDA1068509.1 heavy-metal-associated domain-containing protein [Verrucomicrobiota bacterium]
MKKMQLLSLNTMVLVSLLLGAQARAEVSHVSIAVDGLGCPFCVYGIEKQLKHIDGVKKVDIELKTGLALGAGQIFFLDASCGVFLVPVGIEAVTVQGGA